MAGDVRWTVLAPTAPEWAGRPAASPGAEGAQINDASVVLLLEAPDVSVLALGDLEPEGQDRLAARLPGPLAVDVVKVAHHGSAHQSARLTDLLRPAVAVASAGRGNTYGHPAPSALELYAGTGALVVTTDRCGTVSVGPRSAAGLPVTAACLGDG